MRFILIPLFVFVISAICINGDSEQGVVQGRYNFNHPPWAEDYNPIAVAVVYEDDAISGKVIKPEVEPNLQQKADLEPGIEKGSQITEETITETVEPGTKAVKSDTDDILVKPKARALNVFQIPVMVVYDPVPDTPSSQQTQSPIIKPKRRKIKQLRRRKLQNKTSIITKNSLIKEAATTSKTVTTESLVEPKPVSNKQRSESVQSLGKQVKRERDPVVPIINSENYVYAHNGNFHYSYEGGDGTKAHSEGQLMRNIDNEAAGEAVSGGFSYTDKEGNDFSLTYTADERGYRPIGAHLPTSPPIPPAIARALAYLATATTPEPVTKPSKI